MTLLRARGFYHRYMASQRVIKEELRPVLDSYEQQLEKQQQWIGNLKWISPAITVQESLNQMAGTSMVDYEDFRKQVVVFAGEWRDFLIPFLYNNQNFSQKDYNQLPAFSYASVSKGNSLVMFVLLGVSFCLFGLGFMLYKKKAVLQPV